MVHVTTSTFGNVAILQFPFPIRTTVCTRRSPIGRELHDPRNDHVTHAPPPFFSRNSAVANDDPLKSHFNRLDYPPIKLSQGLPALAENTCGIWIPATAALLEVTVNAVLQVSAW